MNRSLFSFSDPATALMLAGLGLALFSTLAGLLPLAIGMWGDSESIALTVHTGAAMVAAGLTMAGHRQPWLTPACLAHPFVLAPLLLAAWSLVALPGAADPAAALLGSPQTAEGPLLILDTALFIAAGLAIRHQPGASAILGWMVVAAAVILPCLTLFPATTVYFFGAWMVYSAIAAPIAVVVFLEAPLPRFWSRLAVAVAAGVPGVALSGSITAVAAALLALPAIWLACRDTTDRSRREGVFWAGLVVGGVVVLEVGTLILALVYYGHAKPGVRFLESLWSRGHLQVALLTDLADHPWRILIGAGWGQIGDIFTRTVTAAGLPLWDKSWDMMERDIVNSHNLFLEALLAAGLPGLLLRLAGLMAVPLFCRPNLRRAGGMFALALGTLASLWFQLPGTVAMVALGIAALGTVEPPISPSSLSPPRRRRAARIARASVGLVAILAIFQGGMVVTLAWEGVRAGTLDSAYIAARSPPPADSCDDRRLAGWRAQPYLGGLLSRKLLDVRSLRPPATLSNASVIALANLVCLADRPRFHDSVPIQTFVLALRGEIMLVPTNEPYRPVFVGFAQSWDRQVFDYLARAPRRTDVVIPYLVWLDRQGRFEDLVAATDRMLAVNPNDPVPLWYLGAALTRQPGQGVAGLTRMRRALDLGIERLIEVAPALRQQILDSLRDAG